MTTRRPSIHDDARSRSTKHAHFEDTASNHDPNNAKSAESMEKKDATPKISISNDSIHLPVDAEKKKPSPRPSASRSNRPSMKDGSASDKASANAPEAPRRAVKDTTTTPSATEDAHRDRIDPEPRTDDHGLVETDPDNMGTIAQKGTVRSVIGPSLRHGDIEPHASYDHMAQDGMERVRYLNGENLSRPLRMPAKFRRLSYIVVLVAVAIGAGFLTYYFDTTINEPKREQQKMEERLQQDIALDLPNMISLLPMDDATIIATLQSTGDTIFNKSEAQGNTSSLELIKLPADVDLAQAAAMYIKGINKLSGVEAATLLNGSWDLDVDRSKGMNMAIHYADFKSKTVDAAIQNALVTEGLDQTELSESGVDDSGNTFATGNVEVGGITYAWKISALPLNEIYSVNGLPEDAVYVGIRFTS